MIPLDTFDFDDDLVGDDEIGAMLRDQLTFVVDRDTNLSLERETSRLVLDTQGCFADRFGQPWPEHTMNLDRAPDDFFREFSISIKHDRLPPRLRASAFRRHVYALDSVNVVERSQSRSAHSGWNERKRPQDVLELTRPQLIRMRAEGLHLRVLLHLLHWSRVAHERRAQSTELLKKRMPFDNDRNRQSGHQRRGHVGVHA